MSQAKLHAVGTRGANDSCVIATFPCAGDKLVVNAMMSGGPLTTTKHLHESAVFIGVAATVKNRIMLKPNDAIRFKVTHFAASVGDGYASLAFTCASGKSSAARIAKAMFKNLGEAKVFAGYSGAVRAAGDKPDREMFASVYDDVVKSLKKDLHILLTGRGVDKLKKADLDDIGDKVSDAVKGISAPKGKKSAPKAEKAEVVDMPNSLCEVALNGTAGDLTAFLTKSYLETVLRASVDYNGKSLIVHSTSTRAANAQAADRIDSFADQLAKKAKKFGAALLVHMAASRAFGHADVLAKNGKETATKADIKGYIKFKA